MSLQFILGGSGSGKSTYLFQKIVERSMREENRNFFIIVPDQFTMQTQMDVVNMHPRSGIMNIDVLSFSRLSYRILEETGGGGQPVLDDTGKSLVLRKVAGQLQEKLPVLGSNLKKFGYIHQVKSAISEFMQYGIGEKEMSEMMSFSRKRGGLHGKLKDLNTLYSGFKDYLQERYITTEETYDRLARQLKKSKIIKDSVIVLDGFTGFTPVQNRVIEQLMLLSSEIYITLTLDREEEKELSESHLFYLTGKTRTSLKKIALDCGVEVKEDLKMESRGIRYQNRRDLVFLEQNLFRYPIKTYGEQTENLSFFKAETMEEEVRQVCREIRTLLAQDYCYRDIAIIAGDLPEYASLIEELFSQYQIPYFLDETKGITLNPFIEYIRAAIAVMVKQYSYEAVFHYLRSGMLERKREEIDALEQYCLAYGIKGKKAWSTIFLQKNLKEEELAVLNRLREQLVEEFQVLKPGKQPVKKQIQQLYSFLVNNKSQEKLREFEEYFAKKEEKSKEKEYGQIYLLVMELLEQIVSLLGEEVLSWEELGQILDAGFGEIQVGVIPQTIDQVVVGNMERTRLKQIKALFFLGMNEGKVPRTSSKGGILSDLDREFLAESHLELAPTPRQQLFIQKFYFYQMVTKPSHKIFLSYPCLNTEGKSLKPSYFMEQMRRLFPGQEIKEKPAGEQEEPVTYEEARLLAARLFPKVKGHKAKEEEKSLLSSLLPLIKEENELWWRELWEAAYYQYEPLKISKEAAKALYGAVIYSSISRLEKMAACAFAHHLQYGLGLKEREEYGFEAVDAGNVFHGVLEAFAGKLAENNYTWLDFPLEEGRKLLQETVEAYALSYGNTILFSSARNEYGRKKIERILWRTVRTLQYQLQKGKFLPKSFELSFSALEELESVTLTLSREEKMKLGGRIDRVDTFREGEHLYVKVIDYKSGNQNFQLAALYHGLQLQLVMYLNAAMELMQRENPQATVHPGAFLYYHVTDPMIEAKEEFSEEQIEEQIRKELRGNGIINDAPEVLLGMDATHASKSQVAHIEYKKDGSLTANSQVMREDQIAVLQKYAIKKAEDLGKQILEGEIGKQPMVLKERDACTFCSFRQICGFDERLPGYEKRKPEEKEKEEILLQMRRIVEEEQGELYEKSEKGN